MGYFAFSSVLKNQEVIKIDRLPKMAMETHSRIESENPFTTWDKKIFFKEYLPDDHSAIWLVNSGFQQCDVEASFSSLDGKLLNMGEEKVVFNSRSKLKNHIAEFTTFDFTQGNKIIPGMYELDVKATNCKWSGLIPRIMNQFSGPDKEYVAKTKVVLFSKGAEEFNKVLDNIIKKKMELELREQNQNELFWQDLQQKFETLQAVTLQIEQLILDFLRENPTRFRKDLEKMVTEYTQKYGSFLTSFVVENENYFKSIHPDLKGASEKRNYELLVKLTSTKIGLESMKFIEEFQGMKKNPTSKQLSQIEERVKKTYSSIKREISEKIIQVSEDRSQ
jgi:hypothetical protein